MEFPTSPDLSRPAATGTDMDYTLSLDEVSGRYARAGHPRTLRTLQRYCVSGHLDAQKVATTLGDKCSVTPQSVARHIAQVAATGATAGVAPRRSRISSRADQGQGRPAVKDQQISAMLERDRETDILVQGLQKMLTPFLGSPRSEPSSEEGKSQL